MSNGIWYLESCGSFCVLSQLSSLAIFVDRGQCHSLLEAGYAVVLVYGSACVHDRPGLRCFVRVRGAYSDVTGEFPLSLGSP
jgi:hypothetical protein